MPLLPNAALVIDCANRIYNQKMAEYEARGERYTWPEGYLPRALAGAYRVQSIALSMPFFSPVYRELERRDRRLGEVLEPALMEDAKILKVEQRPDIKCAIHGHDMTLKVDTGAVTSVVDARDIRCSYGNAPSKLEAAYDEYVGLYPDHGPLTLDRLNELSMPYRLLDFGYIEQFSLVTQEKNEKTSQVVIAENLPVIGVSNPKIAGKRAGLRPVVTLRVKGDAFAPLTSSHPLLLSIAQG